MKVLDIALKDMTRSFRSMFAVIFMFGIPLLMTGMFYFMFGNIAGSGEFNLPKTKVIVANLDKGGPKFQVNTKNIPGGAKANTMGELVVNVLQSERVAELVDLTLAPDAETARAAVDGQQAQVALIIPQDFSKQFADVDGHAVIEFYQDPTLTIGPGIIRAFLNRFMDGMAGVKIAVNVFLDEAEARDQALAGVVVQRYLDISLAQTENIESKLLDTRAPQKREERRRREAKHFVAPHHADHGRHDDLLRLLHRHIRRAKYSQRRRGAHAAAFIHHAHIASDDPQWKIVGCLPHRVGASHHPAHHLADHLWDPLGRDFTRQSCGIRDYMQRVVIRHFR